MSRFYLAMAGIACFLCGADALMKAIGETPQTIMPDQFVWTWWIAALGWASLAVRLIIFPRSLR